MTYHLKLSQLLLIDKEQSEAKQSKSSHSEQSEQFILQIFSFPVFVAETFFLEIIERQNSRGFGGGNIRALAQSIILMNYLTSLREKWESGKMKSPESSHWNSGEKSPNKQHSADNLCEATA